jgi:drug/metabolite transporter (DMT)-like permease
MLQFILTAGLIGIVLALTASLFWNIAPLLQKEALAEMEEIKAKSFWKSTKVLFTNAKWFFGLILGLIGGVAYMLAIQVAGLAVVQPLINVGLIILAFLAYRRLNENMDKLAIIGIIMMIATPVFIAFGDVTEPVMFTVYDSLLIYSVIILAATAVMLALSPRVPILWSPISALLQSWAAQFTQWFIIVVFTVDGIFNKVSEGIIPLIFLGVLMLISAVYTVSIGLQKNPAARFNAINGTVNMFATVLGGIMIFGQVIQNIPIYSLGLVTGVIGVILLAKFQ